MESPEPDYEPDQQLTITLLSADDLRAALRIAKRQLSPRQADELRQQINEALSRYVSYQLSDLGRRLVPTSKLLRDLRRLAKAAKSSDPEKIRSLWRDPLFVPVIHEVRCVAKTRDVDEATLDTDPALLRLVVADTMSLTQARLGARLHNARARVAPGKTREGRHAGNEYKQELIGTLNTLWTTYFEELAGISHFDAPGGSYLSFIHAILHSAASRVPDDLEKGLPGIRAGLRLSPSAIHGLFRRTRFSDLRRIGKRLLE